MNENEEVVEAQEPTTTPIPEMENEVFSFQVEDTITPEKSEATLAMEAQLAELQAQNASLQEKLQSFPPPAPAAPTFDADALAAALAKANAPKDAPAPQINLEELAKATDPDFYKSPSAAVYKLIAPVLEQQQAMFAKQMEEQQIKTSQAMALGSDSNKGLFEKYGKEIHETAKTIKGSNAYQEAVQRVKMAHMDEIVAEQVAAGIEAGMAKAAEEAAKPKPQTQFTNAGSMGTARPAPAKVTPAQLAKVKQRMLVQGFNPEDPEDQEFMYNLMKTRGEI